MSGKRCAAGLLAVVFALPPCAVAQTAECATTECASAAGSALERTQLWLSAAEIHGLKLQFVEGLQRFTRAQAGTFGDEGAALGESLASMRSALARWDGAIEEFRKRATRMPGPDGHVALATVLLDRHRIEGALEELDAARRRQEGREEGRADVYTLQALAYGMTGRTSDAARALRRAAAIDPDNPATFYTLAQHATAQSRAEETSALTLQALRGFHRALQARKTSGASGASGSSGAALFERVDLLRQSAGVAPLFPQARYAEGFAALRGGDYLAALSRWANAVLADPLTAGDPDPRQRVVSASAALREGRLQDALQLFQAAITVAPDHAETHRLLGLAYWIDDQEGRSIEHLRHAIRLAPDDERARVGLVDVLLSARRLAEAERELMLAMDAGIRSGQIHYRLAQIYQQQSLLPQAVAEFKASEAFGPVIGRDRFYQTVGTTLVNRAEFDEAVTAYRRRIDANPNSGEAHRQLGEVYFLQGRHDEALAEFAAAMWLDPGDARAHAAAGQVYVRTERWADGVGVLQRALALDGRQREARYALGTALIRLGRTDEARRELDTFGRLQAEADAAGRRQFQLDALRREGNRHLVAAAYDRAVVVFEDALRLDPDDPRSRRDLGVALLRAGRPQEALSHLETASAAEQSAELFGYLADAYRASGMTEESARQAALRRAFIERTKLDRIRALIGVS